MLTVVVGNNPPQWAVLWPIGERCVMGEADLGLGCVGMSVVGLATGDSSVRELDRIDDNHP